MCCIVAAAMITACFAQNTNITKVFAKYYFNMFAIIGKRKTDF